MIGVWRTRSQSPAPGTYLEIMRRNAFTLINVVLYATCAMLVAMGLYGDALVTVGLVLFNVVISIFQEIRTKRTLDRISVLTWPKVTVRRDGQDQAIDPTELVQDDLLLIQPGDQIVADGPIVDGHGIEVDESLLTGEADAVAKEVGDKVLSGTFCVSGSGIYRAETVGQAKRRKSIDERSTRVPAVEDSDAAGHGSDRPGVDPGGAARRRAGAHGPGRAGSRGHGPADRSARLRGGARSIRRISGREHSQVRSGDPGA